MIKGVVFDFDGVLVDSPRIYSVNMKRFLSKHGIKLSDSEVARLISFSMSQEFGILKEKYSLNVSFDEFVKHTLLESKKEMEKMLSLMPGAKSLLEELAQNRFSLALASNNNRFVVDWVLKKFGLVHFFDAIVPVELAANPKPAPDIYSKCVQVLALHPSECVGIEDTVVGVKAIKAAGLRAIGLHNEFSDKNFFGEADLVVDSLLELDSKKILALGETK